MTLGTPLHEYKFSANYLWRRTRIDHHALINPSRAINNEDHHIDWLTYRNIIEWNKLAKEFLMEIKMGKDKQGIIRKSSYLIWLQSTITKHAFLFCFISDGVESEMRLIVKTYACPGRQSKQAISIEFHEEMAQLGVVWCKPMWVTK